MTTKRSPTTCTARWYSLYGDKDGVKPQDTANARLITVTPECRQQLVEAYRKYMKKQ